MEIANTLDTGSKYVYYSYVIADNTAQVSNVGTVDDQNTMSTTTMATTPLPSLGSISYATAQQQYPMLVQQCIDNDTDGGGGSESPPNGQTSESQATLNVVLTPIVEPSPIDRIEHVNVDEFVEDDVSESYDEHEDHEDDADYESEQELTSLAWLSDPTHSSAMNMLAAAAGGAVGDDDEEEEDEQDGGAVEAVPTQPMPKQRSEAGSGHKSKGSSKAGVDENLRAVVNDKNVTQERFNKFMQQVQQSQTLYASNELAYRTLTTEKPPFNYAQIIAMAMMECGRMTLKDICTWIRDRFAFYRSMDNWNNSIRHNLSLHFCFTKIARDKTEKGKGGYWELSMNVTKGEKKRVRNRSKRALAAAASNFGGAPQAKRPRRATGPVRMRTSAEGAAGAVGTKASASTVVTIKSENGQQLYANEMAASEAAATAVANELCATFGGNGEFAQIQANMLHDSEIYLGCEIPLSGDCIIIPYNNAGQPPQSHAVNAPNCGPNAQLSLAIPTSQPTSPTSSSQSRDSPSSAMSGQAHAIGGDDMQLPDGGDLTAATLIAHGLTHTMGPNVIVESLPYGGGGGGGAAGAMISTVGGGVGGQSVFDQVGDIERQFSSMVQLPDPELVEYDVYYDFTIGW